jgi:tRNA C32,U32 (ribose-2'-O)-methylase TrmJ
MCAEWAGNILASAQARAVIATIEDVLAGMPLTVAVSAVPSSITSSIAREVAPPTKAARKTKQTMTPKTLKDSLFPLDESSEED